MARAQIILNSPTLIAIVGLTAAVAAACSADDDGGSGFDPGTGSGGSSASGTGANGTGANGTGANGTGGTIIGVGGEASGGGGDGQPQTCAEAIANRSYVGCDFWPTVTYNPVYENFDFAAVVANGSSSPATVEVTRGGSVVATVTVDPGGLQEIALPWVPELKGPAFAGNTSGARVTASVRADGGAYHLTSTVPVTVWQFNPLQYEKELATCQRTPEYGAGTRCLSVSNDAALLLPSSAMTGAYRLFGRSEKNGGPDWGSTPGAYAVTATEDATEVRVQLSGELAAGTGVTAASAGETVTYTLNAGDVLQLLGAQGPFWGDAHADLSGSVLLSDKPVQVIATNPLSSVPDDSVGYADHIEETVLPAEVIGNSYVVAPPTSPDATVVGHVVRFYGNADGTTLSYGGTTPAGAPTTLDAGQVVEIGPVAAPFTVTGSDSFAVGSFMIGGTRQDPSGTDVETRGDPAFSMMVTPEQFRSSYTFLAPVDYMENYADITLQAGTTVTLDGNPVSETPTPIGDTGWSVLRVKLGPGNGGAHALQASGPVGLQVMGFGHATGYYYPGGLNLKLITAPPPIIQ